MQVRLKQEDLNIGFKIAQSWFTNSIINSKSRSLNKYVFEIRLFISSDKCLRSRQLIGTTTI